MVGKSISPPSSRISKLQKLMNYLRPSRVLREMKSGQLATLFKINLSDPRVVEIVAASGVSALWLCNEHVPNDWLNLENQIRAAALHGSDVLVRVSKGPYSDYVRPLEAGATGIIVPHVSTAQEAEQIVQWTRFRPLGNRPIDGGNVDGGYASIPTRDYVEFSNRERLLVLQIESPEAVKNVDAIAAVEGFDLLMFGPGDYAHRIDRIGEIACEEVEAARHRVEAAALRHGKRCVAVAASGSAEELLERGYSLAYAGADVFGIAEAARAALAPYAMSSPAAADSPYAPAAN